MRRSATTQQRDITRRLKRNMNAQSKEHWFLLYNVILAYKELAVGVERRIVVDIAGSGGSPHELGDQIEASELATETEAGSSVKIVASAPQHNLNNKIKSNLSFACTRITQEHRENGLFATW